MIKEASPEQISVYVKSATDRMVEAGKTQEEAETLVQQVLTKRAEELGIDLGESELTPQEVVIGTAYQALVNSGMSEKQAEAAITRKLQG